MQQHFAPNSSNRSNPINAMLGTNREDASEMDAETADLLVSLAKQSDLVNAKLSASDIQRIFAANRSANGNMRFSNFEATLLEFAKRRSDPLEVIERLFTNAGLASNGSAPATAQPQQSQQPWAVPNLNAQFQGGPISSISSAEALQDFYTNASSKSQVALKKQREWEEAVRRMEEEERMRRKWEEESQRAKQEWEQSRVEAERACEAAREEERKHREWDQAMTRAAAEWERLRLEAEQASKVVDEERNKLTAQTEVLRSAEEEQSRIRRDAEEAAKVAQRIYESGHAIGKGLNNAASFRVPPT